MSELYIDVESRIPERIAEMRSRFDELAPFLAEAVGEEVRHRAELVAVARIERPSVVGGYLDAFDVATELDRYAVDFILSNKARHAEFVEFGRPPGEPVLKQYVDNAENRRRGRVGGTYVARHTGMPPSGIFGDGQPDWARRDKIARDGFEGRYIFRELKRGLSAAEVAASVRRRLPALLEV